eukprot:766442-Hanusia_phi.AAC.4
MRNINPPSPPLLPVTPPPHIYPSSSSSPAPFECATPICTVKRGDDKGYGWGEIGGNRGWGGAEDSKTALGLFQRKRRAAMGSQLGWGWVQLDSRRGGDGRGV